VNEYRVTLHQEEAYVEQQPNPDQNQPTATDKRKSGKGKKISFAD
jgi:hypothetical protein